MRQRRRRIAFAAVTDAPISALNTTPLIDVMLVLLIMFIVTLPAMTHKVKIDLPQGVPPVTTADPEIHQLALDPAGRLSWDGAPIAEAALPARLAAFRASAPDGILHFRAEADTRYEDFDRALADVKRAGIERLGFLGNERYARAY
ncbi:MAG: ExbD/TolR family protein [Allosphingosinicella sp.]